jgi:hypothetical protein
MEKKSDGDPRGVLCVDWPTVIDDGFIVSNRRPNILLAIVSECFSEGSFMHQQFRSTLMYLQLPLFLDNGSRAGFFRVE